MAWDWHEYIEHARPLAKSTAQVELRVSISRAYYGAFNLALGYLKAVHGCSPKSGRNKHQWAREKFTELQGEDHVFVSTSLGAMCIARNAADYDYDMNCNVPIKALEVRGLADKVVDTLQRLYEANGHG